MTTSKNLTRKEFTELKSSNLDGYHYDPESEVFSVIFKSSKAKYYSYLGVPDFIFNEFLTADSKGSYFSNNMKKKYSVYTTNFYDDETPFGNHKSTRPTSKFPAFESCSKLAGEVFF